MSYCLPRKEAHKFLDALRTGKIQPEKLMDMTSAERREFFGGLVGKNDAQSVNAMFEEKMLLKDQKRGMVTWAKKVSGISKVRRQSFIDRINGLERVLEPEQERAFMEDLAKQKLGIGVTVDEAKAISLGAKQVTDLRGKFDPKTEKWSSEDARLDYGMAFVHYHNYVGGLMRDASKLTPKEFVRTPSKWIPTTAGALKGIVASLDNSFFGRQGIKMLYSHPSIWTRDFLKSWGDIGRQLRGINAMDLIEADVFSRPNAMNGKYQNTKTAIGIEFEEAYPSQLPEKIPIFGRLYKASEAAFNGGALRMRADYADMMIRKAEEFGVDVSQPGPQAQGIGKLVNAMTGRGDVGPLPKTGMFSADNVNATFFSIRFVKSNFDTLTAHRFGYAIEEGPARAFVRKEAATNLAKIVGGMAGVLFIADQMQPGSVEWDPRSSDFGKIKIGNTRFDISGGMGSMVTLASRILPWSVHNGRASNWSKSSTTGKWTDLRAGKYGQRNAWNVVEGYFEGKFAPLAGGIRDYLSGETFGGGKATPEAMAYNATVPIGIQSTIEAAKNPDGAPWLAVLILDGIGFGANTYSAKKRQN